MVRNFKENLGDTTSHASPDVQLHHATSGEPHGLKYGSVALDMCSRPPGIHVQETLFRDCHRDPKSSEGVNSQDVHQIIHQLTPSKTGSSTVSKAGVLANQRLTHDVQRKALIFMAWKTSSRSGDVWGLTKDNLFKITPTEIAVHFSNIKTKKRHPPSSIMPQWRSNTLGE